MLFKWLGKTIIFALSSVFYRLQVPNSTITYYLTARNIRVFIVSMSNFKKLANLRLLYTMQEYEDACKVN